MLDFTAIAEHSRHHCAAICAFLVPANLISTSLTLLCVAQTRSWFPISKVAALASIFALALFIHVGTWFAIGVVMIPTFVLIALGIVCLAINFWAVRKRQQLQKYLRFGWQFLLNAVAREDSLCREEQI
jgi:CBS-domain-containing membrane protein